MTIQISQDGYCYYIEEKTKQKNNKYGMRRTSFLIPIIGGVDAIIIFSSKTEVLIYKFI